MDMPDGLPAVPASIEDDTVPAVLDTLGGRDLTRRADEFVEQTAAPGGKRGYVREVIPRNHQDMRGRLGIDVTEGDDPLSVQHYRGRDLSGSDPAEQAVWHNTIIVAPGRARCRASPSGAAARPGRAARQRSAGRATPAAYGEFAAM
jgi:hypothetical protein